MRAKVFVFGTSHSLQCGTNQYTREQVEIFRSYLKEICHSREIRFVAEEMSNDVLLEEYKKKTTVVAEVASALSISHEYIDLAISKRVQLYIADGCLINAARNLVADRNKDAGRLRDKLHRRLSDPVRECSWVARILAVSCWPTLFVCGADHTQNIHNLINNIGQEFLAVSIVEADYDPHNASSLGT